MNQETPEAESSTTGAKRYKRRVPPTERQRTDVSCDRCRTRKIRCIRLAQIESCAACEQASAVCEVKIPRKARMYASLDQLPRRYQLLEGLVRKHFQGADLNSLEGLEELAIANGVDVGGGGNDPSKTSDKSPQNQYSFNVEIPTSGAAPSELRPYLSSHSLPHLQEPEPGSGSDSGIFKIPEGCLVPAPRGTYHYVGPASLAYFAKCARDLVSRCNLSHTLSLDDSGLRRYLKAAEFTTFRTSVAIEAKVAGHPATTVADSEEVTSTMSPNQSMNANTGESIPTTFHTSPISSIQTIQTRKLSEHLPDKSLSDQMVKAFFDVVHPNFTIFHRGAFQMKYESFWSQSLRQNDTIEAGWICALYMIYVLGAQVLENGNEGRWKLIQQQYLGLFLKDGLHRIAMTATLSNVQALMLLALYQHNAGERNAAWMLIGQAARTATALGMHRDGHSGNFDPFERNTRRMVWWVLHMFEMNLSSALGRPSSTDLIDVTAVLPEDPYLDANECPIGYFERAVALTEICARVKRFSASIAAEYEDCNQMVKTSQTALYLIAQLDNWKSALPLHLSTKYQFASLKHRRAVTLLHIYCDHLKSIVGRAYILCRVNCDINRNPTIPQQIEGLAGVAVEGAMAVVRGLLDLHYNGILEGCLWLDYYYVHHAGFVMALHFLGRPLDLTNPQHLEYKQPMSDLLSIAQKSKLAPTYRILINVVMQLAYIVGIGPEETSEVDLPIQPLDNILQATQQQPVTQSYPSANNFASNSFFGSGSQHIQTNQQTAFPALEHLFGPIPPSAHNSPPDLFADLYNFGLDTSAANPWDFFNIGVTAEGLMNGLRDFEASQTE